MGLGLLFLVCRSGVVGLIWWLFGLVVGVVAVGLLLALMLGGRLFWFVGLLLCLIACV